MSVKNLVLFFIAFSSMSILAQGRSFSYSHFQLRNNVQEWGKEQNIGKQQVHFTDEEIDLKIDKKYHLTIVSKTDLPDNGAIYLCNDEKSNPVTVMLIDDSKMFVYSKTKRYQICLDPLKIGSVLADTD